MTAKQLLDFAVDGKTTVRDLLQIASEQGELTIRQGVHDTDEAAFERVAQSIIDAVKGE